MIMNKEKNHNFFNSPIVERHIQTPVIEREIRPRFILARPRVTTHEKTSKSNAYYNAVGHLVCGLEQL